MSIPSASAATTAQHSPATQSAAPAIPEPRDVLEVAPAPARPSWTGRPLSLVLATALVIALIAFGGVAVVRASHRSPDSGIVSTGALLSQLHGIVGAGPAERAARNAVYAQLRDNRVEHH